MCIHERLHQVESQHGRLQARNRPITIIQASA